jgi:hypothetical protein
VCTVLVKALLKTVYGSVGLDSGKDPANYVPWIFNIVFTIVVSFERRAKRKN